MGCERGFGQMHIEADLIRRLPELIALLLILGCQSQAPCPHCTAAANAHQMAVNAVAMQQAHLQALM